jgi:hypothetical protein
MQPTPTPTPAPDHSSRNFGPPAVDPVTELIRTQRLNVGYGLLVLAAVFLGATILLGLKANRLTPPSETKTEKDKDRDSEDPFKALQLDTPEVKGPNKYDYVLGAFGAGLGVLIVAGAGAYFLVSLPKPTETLQRTEARVAVLAVGGLLGGLLVILGALYFYRWSDSLIGWLDKNDVKQARWVLIPLLMVLLGGALVFVSGQPARAEERNNTPIRRLIYGSNLGFATLLVLVLLVILNVALGPRLPNRLDTTGTSFYTLSPQTKQLVEGLDQPIRAYAIFQDGDQVNEDAKRLLMSCQDVNPSKFQVTVLSPALNRRDIEKLRADFPLAEMSREGILLVMGEDDGANERKRHTFVRSEDLGETKADANGRQMLVFNGEPKLLRELMYLAENKQRPKIYFTQSSGELALTAAGGRGSDPRRAATVLKSYLEKNYFDVQTLNFDLAGTTKVPDDASVVVVADPSAPIPPSGVAAITEFMNKPRPDGKKGKLVVLAGAQAVDRKQLQIGLEPLLSTYGVGLSDRFVFGSPIPQFGALDKAQGITVLQAAITQDAVEARNPVALGFNKVERLPLVDCRELIPGRGGPVQPLIVMVSAPRRGTWQMKERPARTLDVLKEVQTRAETIENMNVPREQKVKLLDELETELDMHSRSRPLAMFVSEKDGTRPDAPETARVAVFGCGWFISDEASGRAAGFGSQGATLWLDLMGSTLDWVRDRPTVGGITEKPYTTYTLKAGYDDMRMKWVPILLASLTVLALGAGVWVMRRK